MAEYRCPQCGSTEPPLDVTALEDEVKTGCCVDCDLNAPLTAFQRG